jgi:hypothetical protein
MWLVGAFFLGIIGVVFGAINGAALYWAFDWDMPQGALLGAALAGSAGLMWGLLSPRTGTGREETHYSFQPCAWCKGSGQAGKAKKTCAVCYGRGSVLTEQPAHQCPTCKGKGKGVLGRKCKTCYGAGWERYGYLEEESIR